MTTLAYVALGLLLVVTPVLFVIEDVAWQRFVRAVREHTGKQGASQ